MELSARSVNPSTLGLNKIFSTQDFPPLLKLRLHFFLLIMLRIFVVKFPRSCVLLTPLREKEYTEKGHDSEGCDDLTHEYVGRKSSQDGSGSRQLIDGLFLRYCVGICAIGNRQIGEE
jgi:hypothetical protein